MDRTLSNVLSDLPGLDMQPAQPRRSPEDIRRLYQEEGEALRRSRTRAGLWVAVVVYMLFALTDIILIPDVAANTIVARIAVGAAVLLALETFYHRNMSTGWLDATCAASLVMGYVGWLVPAAATANAHEFSYYMIFGSIFMMGANLFFRLRFWLSILASGTILAAFFLAMFDLSSSYTYWVTLGTFYISCFVFTSYVNWNLNKERYNVFLNALEARDRQQEAAERGKALLKLSRTDSLTGLDNRRAVDEALRKLWDEWQHHERHLAVVLVDVDFFKRFNDCYGHQEGDRCLIGVAAALKKVSDQRNASIGRYGGEEFIILARISDEAGVRELAEAARRAVEDLHLKHEQRRDGISIVTASVGASVTRAHGGPKLERLIHEADRALYLAKRSGRNCTHLFDPLDPARSDETENVAALLKIAVEQELVSLVYQPIRGVADSRVEGVETLMRLKMLDGTNVPPSLFIPVAERTGAILELGRWAVRKVCEDLLADGHVEIASVNVSPIQLKSAGFAASIAAILGEAGVHGSRLALEITEGLDMEIHPSILRCINDLKLLGVRIWLDDFGTGFAGLSWLRLIDFDTVKIDRSFLHDCDTNKGSSMLKDIVGLVRNRGPRILVEGVESDEQMNLIRSLKIDQAQGFHLGRPVPAPTLLAALSGEDNSFSRMAS